MVNYTCDKCNKLFDKKFNYLAHINKKFPCQPNILNETYCQDFIHWLRLLSA